VPKRRELQQVKSAMCSTVTIMSSAAFQAGVDDVRRGLAPRFDVFNAYDRDELWAYERGRLWASIAPIAMPVTVSGRLNPRAVALLNAAFARKLIT
jgi:hypothetical protein